MSESQFTPGPWKVFGRPYDRYFAVIDSIPDRDGAVVANCICHVALTNEDAKANANLIAAAPELLAACESLVAAMNEYEWSVDDSPTPQHKVMMQSAIKAIEKAKGEE
jgi:hypothetical protein